MSLFVGNFRNEPNFPEGKDMRISGHIVTTSPESGSMEASSRYLQGDVVYQQGNKAIVRDCIEGNLSFDNFDTGETVGIDCQDGSIQDLVDFINLCWNEFEDFDSEVIMDQILR